MIKFRKITKKNTYSTLISKRKIREYSTQNEVQMAEPVEYPKIEEMTPRGFQLRKQEAYYKKIQALQTVEEKLFALNLPRYYGWPVFVYKEGFLPYNFLPFSQFVTRTVINENNILPLNLMDEKSKELLRQVKSELEKVLVFEYNAKRYKYEIEKKFVEEEKEEYFSSAAISDIKTKYLIKQINSAIVRVLSSQYPHLYSAQVDYEPRLESFWRVGGFFITEKDRKLRKDKKIDETLLEDPIDRFLAYFGNPMLQLRSKVPLPPLPKIKLKQPKLTEESIEQSEIPCIPNQETAENVQIEKPKDSMSEKPNEVANIGPTQTALPNDQFFYPLQEYRYSPDIYLEIPRERMHGAVIPGFWPNDPYRFGVLSYHSRSHMIDRPTHYGFQDHKEALHAQALLASFAWSYGLACYQGFSTYNDITYPFTTQSVITDGKIFSFYQYQLNTIVLHTANNEPHNALYNECHATPPQELYHNISEEKVEGWNDQALLNLISLYTNVPESRDGIDLNPYLDKKQKYLSAIEDTKRRVWFHNIYRHLVSHRPRKKLAPEIYDWERIYKVEHQIRVKDARKRFFEKFEDPINDRRLHDHTPPYVPKHLREPNKRRQERYSDQFYPEDALPDYHEIV